MDLNSINIQKSRPRLGPSSSLPPDSMHHDYNFNNLPSFVNSTKSNNAAINNNLTENSTNLNPNNSFNNPINVSSPPNDVNLPFVPSKELPINENFFNETRLPSSRFQSRLTSVNSNFSSKAPKTRIPSQMFRKFSKKSLFNSFSDNSINENFIKLQENVKNNNINEILNPQTEFVTFIKSFGLLLLLLLKKTSLWVLFFLTYFCSSCLKLTNKIPNPNWILLDQKNNDLENEIVASSTPQFRKPNNKLTTIFKSKNHEKSEIEAVHEPGTLGDDFSETPLLLRKVKTLKNNVKISNKLQEEKLRLELDEHFINNKPILVKQPNKLNDQYGTFFFKSDKPNKPNLETYFLKSNFNQTPQESYEPYSLSKDILTKSSDISSSLKNIYYHLSNNSTPRPTFSRSTTRFKDLEWLKNDTEDYLNNLESTKLYKEYQKIMEERSKMQQLLHLTKLKDSGKVIQLTPSQLDDVESLWKKPPSGIITSKFNIDIAARDILTLSDRRWLNDNVIDFYLNLIKQRSLTSKSLPQIHTFSTYFYTTLRERGYNGVKKWAKRAKVDVSKVDYIFAPINLHQTHWALGIIDNKHQRFIYADSLYGEGSDVLYNLQDYMINETKKIYGNGMNGMDYSLYDMMDSYKVPKQENGFDCGVFACTAVDYISREKALLYSQADMPLLRRRMAYEIINGTLIDH